MCARGTEWFIPSVRVSISVANEGPISVANEEPFSVANYEGLELRETLHSYNE